MLSSVHVHIHVISTELPLLSFCHLPFRPQPILPFQQDTGPSLSDRFARGCGHGSSSGSGGSGEGGRKFFWLDPILGQRTVYIFMAPYAQTSGFGP